MKPTVVDIIVGKMNPTKHMRKPEKVQSSDFVQEIDSDDESSVMLESAAEEVLSAVKQSDAKALMEALKSFMSLCGEDEYESQESSEED